MSYLEEFQLYIENEDFVGFIQLWEEYCTSEIVDEMEFCKILDMVKSSFFAEPFGKYADLAIPLWETIEKDDYSYREKVMNLNKKGPR